MTESAAQLYVAGRTTEAGAALAGFTSPAKAGSDNAANRETSRSLLV